MLLSMKQITKDFGAVRVLHGIDFDVAKGEIHALVGHNGAGKSTLIKVLGGNFADYGGSVELQGQPLTLKSPAEALGAGIAIIYQDFALAPNLSVADNIGLGREPNGRLPGTIDHGALRRRSAEEADRLGIELPMDRRVGSLGVAAQQLTEIVRAFSRPVRILVMDEPTARLAPAERRQLFAIMRGMARERDVGIVYISHFLEEVVALADRITVLRDGRGISTGPRADYDVRTLSALLVGHEFESGIRKERRPASGGALHVLSVRGLIYPGQASLDLDVQTGEIVGIAGLVGSGRTRLARALVGDLESRGDVVVRGRHLPHRTPTSAARAGLVMVPEDRKVNGLAANASVAENVAATALQAGTTRSVLVDPGRIRRLAESMIERFGIRPPDPTRIVATLSGGNAQKVLVARAVASEPAVMILDQPTAGVDIGAKAELHALLKLAADEGAGIVLISDELEELIEISDRLLVIAGGQLRDGPALPGVSPAALLAAMSAGFEAA
jgi:ABC-type sugar transport system ATPase subunit